MGVDMLGTRMRNRLAGMAVGVDVNRAVAMAVPMEMDAIAPQPPQHMRAETASGTAITLDSAPIPTIEPIPNSAM